MTRMKIISVPDKKTGKLTGWLEDKPGVIAQGDDFADLVKNIMHVHELYTEVEEELKNEKK